MSDQNDIFFSVVVPTYNRADLITKTLQSLLNQQYTNYEIIVVDDGSTDNTEEVVKSLDNQRIIYVKKNNAERAAARNYGAAMAKGEYINFFDSDDLAYPNHISEAIGIIKQYKKPEWFHLSYAVADPSGAILRNAAKYSAPTLNKQLVKGNILSCNGVFIKKDILLANPFIEDRELSASEDYELWCRLAARFPLVYSNTITTLVVDHEMRSVRKINGEQLITRLNSLSHHLEQDSMVVAYFGKGVNQIKMYASSYIAVHLSDQPAFKLTSIQYLIKAISQSVAIVKKKVFYAIIKNLIIKW
jgi:glycosyltransferase involved in cell wall biosynthesis